MAKTKEGDTRISKRIKNFRSHLKEKFKSKENSFLYE